MPSAQVWARMDQLSLATRTKRHLGLVRAGRVKQTEHLGPMMGTPAEAANCVVWQSN